MSSLNRRVAALLASLQGSLLPHDTAVTLDGIAAHRFVLFIPRDASGQEVSPARLEELVRALDARLGEAFSGEAFASMAPGVRFELGSSLLLDDPFYRFERLVYRAVERARSATRMHDERHRSRDEAELRRILHEGALEVVFQPIYSLVTGQVLGYEALSRGPEDGPFRDPRAMFEASHACGLATELDALCQRNAIFGGRQLPRGAKIFVNALSTTLLDPTVGARRPLEWIDQAGLERGDVVLEFSERGPQQEVEKFGRQVGLLRDSGVGVALDDIGTGLTGLQAIEEMKPDYLKLDVSLVHNIHKNLLTQELLRSLTRVAHSIGSAVVGEGVESEEEETALRDCGTDFAQGFWFSRPAPLGSPQS